ncbi:MAG: NADH-quinone oxidoreductase subunit L, partial [Candidatus Kapaibacterium sp.]
PAALGGHSIPNYLEHWLEPVFAQSQEILTRPHVHEIHSIEYVLMGASLVIAIIGIVIATRLYKQHSDVPASVSKRFGGLYDLLWNKYRLDEAYQTLFVDSTFALSNSALWKVFDVRIVDGAVNGTAKLVEMFGQRLRRVQTGIVQNYAVVMLAGIVMLLIYMVL